MGELIHVVLEYETNVSRRAGQRRSAKGAHRPETVSTVRNCYVGPISKTDTHSTRINWNCGRERTHRKYDNNRKLREGKLLKEQQLLIPVFFYNLASASLTDLKDDKHKGTTTWNRRVGNNLLDCFLAAHMTTRIKRERGKSRIHVKRRLQTHAKFYHWSQLKRTCISMETTAKQNVSPLNK